jgi:hypothetical protein
MIGIPMVFIPTPASEMQSVQPAKRALLVGTDVYKNYPKYPTPGAEEDIRQTKRILIDKYGFRESEIKVLLREEATAQNLREAFRGWVIQGTKPGDKVYFHYSGHGMRVNDFDGDESTRVAGDTMDEALAPYDVGDSRNSIVTDDEIGQFINQLSGRMAVLVFDSCFSGTVSRGSAEPRSNDRREIARYLPSPEEIQALVTRSGAKGELADYVVLPPGSGSRDLSLVVDKDSIKSGGIVIFSAAQPHQLAFSVPVGPNYFRGAFTYLLNEYLFENPRMPLRDLRSKLVGGMAKLRPLLTQEQTPYFEVFSAVPLEDQPMFGEALAAPAIALSNPVSTIDLRIRTLEGKKDNIYQFGTVNGQPYNETVSYEVQTSEPGYLYLIVFSVGDPARQEDNVATRIFPNASQKDNRVERGAHRIFRAPLTKEGFQVTEPAGKDIVVALLSSSKLNFGQESGYERDSYKWEEVFNLLKSRRFSEQVETLSRGQTAKGQTAPPPLDMTKWQSASIIVEARKINR